MRKMISISNKSVVAAILFTGLIYLFYYNYAENATNLHDMVLSFKDLAKADQGIYGQREMQQALKREEDAVIPQDKNEVSPTTEKNEEYLHTDLYDRDLTLINITNFKFVINNDICNVRRVALVTIIHTAVDNHEARSMIRSVTGKNICDSQA